VRFSGYCSGSVRADGVAYDHDLAAGEAANAPGAAEWYVLTRADPPFCSPRLRVDGGSAEPDWGTHA